MALRSSRGGSRSKLELTRSTSRRYGRTSATNKSILSSTIAKRHDSHSRGVSPPVSPGHDQTPPPDSISLAPDQEVDIYGETNVRQEVEKACLIALRTIVNMNDQVMEGKSSRDELLVYVRKVFPVYQRWDDLHKQAQEFQITEWNLIVSVLSASGLEAKDMSGKSDPYVRLGIIHMEHMEDKTVRNDNMTDWEREGFLVGKVHHSEVVKQDLNPVWNEEIMLKFDDIGNDVLVIEVWDSDGAIDGQERKIKEFNLRGVKEFLHNTLARDDFIGRVFYPLSNIAANGKEETLTLHSHSKKHERGKIKVIMNIESVRRNVSVEQSLSEHKLLMKGLMNAESRTVRGKYIRDWDGHLSDKAVTLLNHHEFIVEMKDIQKTAIELSVLVRYHRLFGVSITTFLRLVLTIKSQYKLFVKLATPKEEEIVDPSDLIDDDLYPGSPKRKKAEEEWKVDMFHDLEELLDSLVSVFRVHLTKFKLIDITATKEYQKLATFVKVADELSSLDEDPTVQLTDDKHSVAGLVTEALPLAVSDWFLYTKEKIEKDETSQGVLDSLERLCSSSFDMSRVAQARIAPVFLQSGLKINYFSHFILAIDKLISNEVITVLGDYLDTMNPAKHPIDDESVLKTYSSYILLKKLRALAVKPNVDWDIVDPEQLSLAQLHTWFRELVPSWIKAASERSRQQVKAAIEIEKVVVVTDEVKFSSSAVDASGTLLALFKVRDDLEWPVELERMEYTLMLIREATDTALYYVDNVNGRMKDEYIYDEHGQFRVTEQLCIILNNMLHMAQVFEKWDDIIPKKEATNNRTKPEAPNDETVPEVVVTDDSKPEAENDEAKPEAANDDTKPREEEETVTRTPVDEIAEEITGGLKAFSDIVWLKIKTIVLKIVEKIKPDLERRLTELLDEEKIVKPDDYETVDREDVGSIGPLLDYLTSNLQTLAGHLLSDVFDLILKFIWYVAMEAISSLIPTISEEERLNRADLHERLYYSLLMLKKFFHGGGNGLKIEDLEDDEYFALEKKLHVLRLPTNDLVLHYLSDLAVPREGKGLGKLLITAWYLESRELVEVNMLQGVDMMSAGSFSKFFTCFRSFNPFFEVTLLPQWMFEESSRTTKRTGKQSNTNNPVFNQIIHLPATKESLSREGASLVFTAFNQSCGKRYTSMAIIPCSEIPVYSPRGESMERTEDGEDVDGTHMGPKNFTLTLFANEEQTLAYKEIMMRVEQADSRAVEFVKTNSVILQSV